MFWLSFSSGQVMIVAYTFLNRMNGRWALWVSFITLSSRVSMSQVYRQTMLCMTWMYMYCTSRTRWHCPERDILIIWSQPASVLIETNYRIITVLIHLSDAQISTIGSDLVRFNTPVTHIALTFRTFLIRIIRDMYDMGTSLREHGQNNT